MSIPKPTKDNKMSIRSATSPFSTPRFTSSNKADVIPYRNFYGSGKFKFFVYPDDGWNPKWGKKPLLGTVYGDEPFYAVREAYSKGLVPMNITFGLIALKEKLDEEQYTSRRFK